MADKPVTRHEAIDPSGKPVTRHEAVPAQAKPVTRHEMTQGPGSAATRHEEVPEALRRFQLPAEITSRYVYEGDLSSAGAQADVVLCRDRSSGEQVAIKIYRPEMTAALESDALASLAEADRAHVVPFRLESNRHQVWEVQEYFPLGSLEDAVRARGGGAQPDGFCREVLREVALSLDHIHSRNIVHRDLKPQNILIRSLSPLDTVLADFGLARLGAMSRAVRSVAGTAHYTSPEGAVGRGNKANDWWGLGIIVHELLTGRHMFSGPDGHYLSDNEVRAAFFDHSWSYADVTSHRWRLLLDGLFAPGEHRWSWPQVDAWLRGESPKAVPWTASATPQSSRRSRAYHFAAGEHHTPQELASAIRDNFMLARDHISGVKASDLISWLHSTSVGTAADDLLVAARAGTASPGRAVVELQFLLDPDTPPVYQDRVLSSEALSEAAKEALSGDTTAADWIKNLRDSAVLTVMGRYSDNPTMSHADELLNEWWRELEEILWRPAWREAAIQPLVEAARPRLEGVLLGAALNTQTRGDLSARASKALAEMPSGDSNAPGVTAVTSLRATTSSSTAATDALAMFVVPAWSAQENLRRAAAKRAADEQERQRREHAKAAAQAQARARREAELQQLRAQAASRRTSDWKAVFWAVAMCVTVLVPWLIGRYMVRGGTLQGDGVFDPTARETGTYFVADWTAGCVVIGLIAAAFVLLRPWRGRVAHVVLAGALVVALLGALLPFSNEQKQTAEAATVHRLTSEPYPFDEKFYTCGTEMVEFTDKAGKTSFYTFATGRTSGRVEPGCDQIHLFNGWRRIAYVGLPDDQAVVPDEMIGNGLTKKEGATPGASVFTAELVGGGSVSYSIDELLKTSAIDTQPSVG